MSLLTPVFFQFWFCLLLVISLLETAATTSLAADSGVGLVTRQPTDKTASIGGLATFAPIISTSLPTTYQWLLHGARIPDETNLNLTILNCQRTDSGWYVLQVDNDAGRINTNPAYLTVRGIPAGTIQFRNGGFSAARINSSSGSGVAGTSIELFAGTEPDRVKSTGAIASVNNGYFVGNTIQFPSVAPLQIVFVQARLGDGRISNLFPIQSGNGVVGGTLENLRFPTANWPAPVFLAEPQDVELNLGEPLTLSVTIRGYTNIRVFWIKDGAQVSLHEETLSLSSQTTVEGTATFTIPAVTLEDAGNYKAILNVGDGFTYAVSAEANVRAVIPAAGRLDTIKLIDGVLQITGTGRANRVYTLQSKTPATSWMSGSSASSSTGLFTFPFLNPPAEPTWFRLRSSN